MLLLAIGYRRRGTAPIFSDIPQTRRAVDPVVQALTLTDIVVAVTVSALLVALAEGARANRNAGSRGSAGAAGMNALVPVTVTIPLLGAPLVAASGPWIGKRGDDVAAIAAAAAATVLATLVLLRSFDAPLVYWLGNWRPRNGVAPGISFAVDPLGAAIALLACVLVTAALVYSWRFFDFVKTHFHVLVLLFLGGAIGFSYTGDLFNMFVFLELMSVAAFALTAFRIGD